MNKPCAVSWCVALASPNGDFCQHHVAGKIERPGTHPGPWRSWWERKPKWPPTPWDDEFERRDAGPAARA